MLAEFDPARLPREPWVDRPADGSKVCSMSPAVREADVIVVGAGLSGLIAARTLIAAGLQPLVPRADDRVGGRILTEEVARGLPVEIGAQWIGDTHRRMFALAAELGVETFAQYDQGETSYELVGSGVLRENTFHERFADDLAELEKVLCRLDELAAEVPTDAPWSAPHAAEWDAITAGSWYDAQGLSPVAANCWRSARWASWRCRPSRCPSCTCSSPSRPAGSPRAVRRVRGGAQTTRFVGGTAEIPKPAGRLLISEHIVLGARSADRAQRRPCHGALPGRVGGARTAGDRGDLSDPGRPDHVRPPLPGTRDLLTQRLPNASAMKAFFVYDEPFWQADGLNGQVISDVGPARMSNDTCMPGDDHGVILLFLEGEQARTFGRMPQEDRRDLLAAELVRHFGPRAACPSCTPMASGPSGSGRVAATTPISDRWCGRTSVPHSPNPSA